MHIQNCSIAPINSEHAVKSVSFICELGANLSSEKIQEVISHYDHSDGLRNLFHKKTEGRETSISLSPNGIDVSNKSGQINQVVLERIGERGEVEFALAIRNNVINFNSNLYSRWANVSNDAVALLNEFTGLVLPDPGISVFGLQYVDEFIVTGEINSFRPQMLFKLNNHILPSHIANMAGPWHNHTGWFDDATLAQDKILHNLNINVVPQHEKLVIQIIGAHRYILSAPSSSASDIRADMTNKFLILHEKNKDLLRGLLNETACAEIHLGIKL